MVTPWTRPRSPADSDCFSGNSVFAVLGSFSAVWRLQSESLVNHTCLHWKRKILILQLIETDFNCSPSMNIDEYWILMNIEYWYWILVNIDSPSMNIDPSFWHRSETTFASKFATSVLTRSGRTVEAGDGKVRKKRKNSKIWEFGKIWEWVALTLPYIFLPTMDVEAPLWYAGKSTFAFRIIVSKDLSSCAWMRSWYWSVQVFYVWWIIDPLLILFE